MTELEFTTLAAQLKKGNNQSLKFIFENYSSYCLENLQRKTGCSYEEAEDILMDAIINFRDKMLAGKITYLTNLRNYIYTTCVNMQRARFQKKMQFEKNKDSLKMLYYQPEKEMSYGEDNQVSYKEQLLNISQETFEQLGKSCQEILKDFYIYKMKMEAIAEKMGMANANVAKTTKSRCFKKWMQMARDLQVTKNN